MSLYSVNAASSMIRNTDWMMEFVSVMDEVCGSTVRDLIRSIQDYIQHDIRRVVCRMYIMANEIPEYPYDSLHDDAYDDACLRHRLRPGRFLYHSMWKKWVFAVQTFIQESRTPIYHLLVTCDPPLQESMDMKYLCGNFDSSVTPEGVNQVDHENRELYGVRDLMVDELSNGLLMIDGRDCIRWVGNTGNRIVITIISVAAIDMHQPIDSFDAFWKDPNTHTLYVVYSYGVGSGLLYRPRTGILVLNRILHQPGDTSIEYTYEPNLQPRFTANHIAFFAPSLSMPNFYVVDDTSMILKQWSKDEQHVIWHVDSDARKNGSIHMSRLASTSISHLSNVQRAFSVSDDEMRFVGIVDSSLSLMTIDHATSLCSTAPGTACDVVVKTHDLVDETILSSRISDCIVPIWMHVPTSTQTDDINHATHAHLSANDMYLLNSYGELLVFPNLLLTNHYH